MSYPRTNFLVTDTGAVDTGRSLSAQLWQDSLTGFGGNSPDLGRFEIEDFDAFENQSDATSANGWWLQDAGAATAENFSSINSSIGEVVLSGTTGTDHDGVEAHSGGTATTGGKFTTFGHATLARGLVGYEVRLDPANAAIFFAGWGEPGANFLSATSALPTTDYCGFFRATLTGDITFVARKGSNTDSAVVQTTAALVAGHNKYGFTIDPAGVVRLTANGVYQSASSLSIATNALPAEVLCNQFSTMNGTESEPATVALTVDWLATLISDAQ